MAGMKYDMIGGDPSIKEKGYDMNGKDSGKGKGMDYEMNGGAEEVKEKVGEHKESKE